MRLDLFCKQVSLTMMGLIVKKIKFQWKSIIESCGYCMLVLFIVFELSLNTCKLG